MFVSPVTYRRIGRGSFKSVLLCCTTLASGTAIAQDRFQLDDVFLEVAEQNSGAADAQSIVATELSSGGKLAGKILDIPASVSVITSRDIEARGATNVEQVLNYTAGVTTDSYGADDRFDYFILRGFDAYTYRDGLSLGANFGSLREEPFAFERVEVIRGASSSTFGVSDPGGSVNYVTKRPRAERFGSVYTSIDSFSSLETGVDFGDKLDEAGTLSYRFTGLLRNGELEYPYSENDELFAMGGLTWRPSDASELTVIVDHLNRDSVPGSGGFPAGGDFDRGDVFYGEPDYNYRGTERTTVSLLGAHDFGNGLSFAGTLRYSDSASDFGYAYVSDGAPADATVDRAFFASDSTGKSFITDMHLTYESFFAGAASITTAGIEFSWSDESNQRFWGPAPSVDRDTPVYTGRPASVPIFADLDTETEGKAIYVQQELNWNERLIASFGLRHDWIDVTQNNNLSSTVQTNDISETTGRIGLSYKITPDVSIFGSYAQSVVPAGFGVDPEQGEQFELGTKWQPAGTNALLTASVYDLSKNNITRTNPVNNLPETIGEIGVRGLDLEAKAEMGAYTFTAAYSYLDAEIKENGTSGNVGNRPGLVSENVASIWASRTWDNVGRGDLTVGLGARFNGGYFYDDGNATGDTGSFVVVDAAVTYDLSAQTSLSANVTNLFDEKHTSYGGSYADFYSPGREVTVKLSHSW
tara:strand:- start:5604 stop:7700 length:2097 start_codon:yes stop_codon:yes gene_type:complete